MPKVKARPISRYSAEAIQLLGQLIREGRIARHMTGEDFAARAGISRSLLHRIEKGDPSCSLGAAFEAAAIAGVRLFGADREGLAVERAASGERLSLLPKYARPLRSKVSDDF